MNHLYESKDGIIHACEGTSMHPDNPVGTKLVWTKCSKDVPANKSFMGAEKITCQACAEAIDRIKDLVEQDDGQAYKEAERFLSKPKQHSQKHKKDCQKQLNTPYGLGGSDDAN